MIFERVLRLLMDLVFAVLSWVPIPGVPPWARASASSINVVLGYLDPLCSWVPWPLVASVFAGVVVCWGWAMGAAGLKNFISLISGGGGK